MIWYAAYGSNLSFERFRIYLRGGIPEGATHEYPGCRDASDPVEIRPYEMEGFEFCFGATSKTWGGGVAFVRPAPGARVLARIYLITDEQFADVIAQENWLEPGNATIDGGAYMYGVVPVLGELDGHEIRTITQAADTPLNPPSGRYVRHIADGLRETYGMSQAEIDAYLGLR